MGGNITRVNTDVQRGGSEELRKYETALKKGLEQQLDIYLEAIQGKRSAYLPPELGEEKKLELRNKLNLAKQVLEKGDLEKAYNLANPIIKFLEVNNLLQHSLSLLNAETSEILKRTVDDAYKEIQSGNNQKASEILNSVFNFLLLKSRLESALKYRQITQELVTQLNTYGDKAFEFIKAGEYQKAATLTGLAILKVEREKELAKLQSLLPTITKYKVAIDIEYLEMFRVKSTDGKWRFSPEKFKELTGVSYNDYKNGNFVGERGLGLVIAEKMRAATHYLNISLRHLDSAMKELAEDKDYSENFNESLQYYEKANELAGAVNGMMTTVASRMQIADHRAVLAKLDFSSGETKIDGPAAREELNREKEKAQKILDDVSAALVVVFFKFAAGNTSEAVALSKRAHQQFKDFEKQVTKLNDLFFYAKSFEQTLEVMGKEADTTLRNILLTLDDAAYELFEMEKTEPAKDVSQRLKRIKKLTGSKEESDDPVKKMLASAIDSLSVTASDLADASEQLKLMRAKLLESYLPSGITMRRSKKLEDQTSFENSELQKLWLEYVGLWEKSIGQAHALISEIPNMLVQTYDIIGELQKSVIEQEAQVEKELKQIRKRKIAAIGIGTAVGAVVTAATLGFGTGAGIAAGTGTTTALLGTIAVSTLAVGGGVLAGYGAGATYLQWKVAEDQGAPKEEVEKYRKEFYYQLVLSGLMAVGGIAGAGIRALEVGSAARWVSSVGLTTFRIADYTALGALTLDGLYTTYQFIKEGSTGMAMLTGAMTLIPFAAHTVIKLAGPKRLQPGLVVAKAERVPEGGAQKTVNPATYEVALPELKKEELIAKYKTMTTVGAEVEGVPHNVVDDYFVMLINEEAATSGAARDVAVSSVVGSIVDDAERVASLVKKGATLENKYDKLIHNLAQMRAAEFGRAISAEDYLYAAMVKYNIVKLSMTIADGHVAHAIAAGCLYIAERVQTERLPAILKEYGESINKLVDAVPILKSKGPTSEACSELFTSLAMMYVDGVKDPLAIITNAEKTGLLDKLNIADDVVALTTVGRVLHRLCDVKLVTKIPGEKLSGIFTQLLDELNKIGKAAGGEAYNNYLNTILSDKFKWEKVIKLEKLKKNIPLLAYGLDDPDGILIRALDKKDMRDELGNIQIFTMMARFLEVLPDVDNSSNEGAAFLKIVKTCLEYTVNPGNFSKYEGAEAARKFFVREKLKYIIDVWELFKHKIITTDEFLKLTTALSEHQSKNAFEEFIKVYADVVVSKLKIDLPQEFVFANMPLVIDILRYRRKLINILKLIKKGEFSDYVGIREINILKDAIYAFDEAAKAHAAGPEAFREFKFSKEFEKELKAVVGDERGSKVFETWRSDTTTELELDKTYIISETGNFKDAFYCGNINGIKTCQHIDNNHVTVTGIVGTIELPWIKQVVVRVKDRKDLIFRRNLVLVKGENGELILLVQPSYYYPGLKHASDINNAVIEMLKAKYEPLGIQIRDIQHGYSYDYNGINSGYMTFTSGKSPFFYIDSNKHEIGEFRNGLWTRNPGEEVYWPIGWRSEHKQ
jgi:hypothetical protein